MKLLLAGLEMEESICQNYPTTQGNLQIQYNPYQNTNAIFHRTRTKKKLNLYGNTKTLNSQSNLWKEKELEELGFLISHYTTKLQ